MTPIPESLLVANLCFTAAVREKYKLIQMHVDSGVVHVHVGIGVVHVDSGVVHVHVGIGDLCII